MNTRKAVLYLEDGRLFEGHGFGAEGESVGEVVFNMSMTGYQEILTDPSYAGQIVVMTQPEIGNYGVNLEDEESRKLFVEGFIVRECSPNFQSPARTPGSNFCEQIRVLFLRRQAGRHRCILVSEGQDEILYQASDRASGGDS